MYGQIPEGKAVLIFLSSLPDMEFVTCCAQLFKFYRRKRANRDIFGQKLKMEVVLLMSYILNTLILFSTQIQTKKLQHL